MVHITKPTDKGGVVSAALDAANNVRRRRADIRHQIREHGRREAWRIICRYVKSKPGELANMPVCDLLSMNMWASWPRIKDIAIDAGVMYTTVGDITNTELERLLALLEAEIARKSPLDMED
jgi:hypothetical protein